MARQLGYTQTELEGLDAGGRGVFDEAIRAALDYAERMTRNAHTVTDEVFDGMRKHYTEQQILEITCVVALSNYWNRFTTALRIDLSGSDEPYDPPSASGA